MVAIFRLRNRRWHGASGARRRPDAVLMEHDPWGDFCRNHGVYRTAQQPYVPLLALGCALCDAAERDGGLRISPLPDHWDTETRLGPATEADRLILDWCGAHGLLGIVPALARTIRFPAWSKPLEDPSVWESGQCSHVKTGRPVVHLERLL